MFDERRPVVLLSGDERSDFQAIQIVPPSGMDISGLGVEVPVGAVEGIPYEGVVRLVFPHPDFLFCTWLTSVSADSLLERAGTLPPAKLGEIDEALRLSSRQPNRDSDAHADATARLNEIRDRLRAEKRSDGGGQARTAGE
jgi:mRNA interferase MazF